MTETVSLSADTLARARSAARDEGVPLSVWLERTVRRAALRNAARREDEWLAANPEVREELDDFDRLADTLESGWSDLTGAA
jgi:D-serine deaminase-like pyridoxal phosphate-dependent protein